MSDKSWLLNASAVRAARDCIRVVEAELGVRLRLSHPDFLPLLSEYAQLADSDELTCAFNTLLSVSNAPESAKSLPQAVGGGSAKIYTIASPKAEVQTPQSSRYVEYNGKNYERQVGEKVFKGLYRGQPVYG